MLVICDDTLRMMKDENANLLMSSIDPIGLGFSKTLDKRLTYLSVEAGHFL